MLIAGNKNYGLAQSLAKLYPDAVYASRTTGFDLTDYEDQQRFGKLSAEHDIIILCSALWRFHQTILLEAVYNNCVKQESRKHVICIGSTADRVKGGKTWLYAAEKKALRDYSNTLALGGVWDKTPKITYVSFGSMTNMQHKHPERKCLDIDLAASYVKWIVDQPPFVGINEISIDPMQNEKWYNSI